MMSEDLRISLTQWQNIFPPDLECSAICSVDIPHDLVKYSLLDDSEILGFIVFGTYTGEIIRWGLIESDCIPLSVSFGHTKKIVSIQNCTFPGNKFCFASLSTDGVLCIWSALDGICMCKKTGILPDGAQKMASCGEHLLISGAFPNLYLFNTNIGQITQILHPAMRSVRGISFLKLSDSKLIFTIDGKGAATYSKIEEYLNPTQGNPIKTKTTKIIMGNPSTIALTCSISPNFKYIISIHKDFYTITNLCIPNFPQMNIDKQGVMDAVWLSDDYFALVTYSGTVELYIIPDIFPKTEEELTPKTHAQIISNQLQKDLNVNVDGGFLNTDEFNKYAFQVAKYYKNMELPQQCVLIEGGVPFPILSKCQGEVMFGYGDSFALGCHHFNEYSLHTIYDEGTKEITSQCLEIENGIVKHIYNGCYDGSIMIYSPTTQTTQTILNVHKKMVNEICTCGDYWFSAGKDAIVKAFSLKTNEHVKTFENFISPVSIFLRPESKTGIECDDYLFCLTESGCLSIIDINTLENVFNMTGHDDQVQEIFVHPLTQMLIVKAKSLYFWSLATGNLESLMSGNAMTSYLNSMRPNCIQIKHFGDIVEGIVFEQVMYGDRSLRVIDIDVMKTAPILKKYLENNMNTELKTMMLNFPNIALIAEIFNSKVLTYLNEKCSTHYGYSFLFGFVGHSHVHTVFLQKTRHATIYEISPQVSGLLLTTRMILASSMACHPVLRNVMESLLKMTLNDMTTNYKHFQNPSLPILFKYVSVCDQELQDLLMKFIEFYPEKTRMEWLHNFEKIYHMSKIDRELFLFTWVGLGITLLKSLDSSNIKSIAQRIIHFSNSSSHFKTFAGYLIEKGLISFSEDIHLMKGIIQATVDEFGESDRLLLLLEKVPIPYIQLTKESLINSDERVGSTLLSQIVNYICNKNADEEKQQLFLGMLIHAQTCSKTLQDLLFIQYKKIDIFFKWFSFNNQIKILAYATKTGVVYITKFIENHAPATKRDRSNSHSNRMTANSNQKFSSTSSLIDISEILPFKCKNITAVYNIGKKSIDQVEIDASGKYLFALSKEDGSFYQILMTEKESSLQLSVILTLQTETNAQLVWKGSDELCIKANNNIIKTITLNENKEKKGKESSSKKSKDGDKNSKETSSETSARKLMKRRRSNSSKF